MFTKALAYLSVLRRFIVFLKPFVGRVRTAAHLVKLQDDAGYPRAEYLKFLVRVFATYDLLVTHLRSGGTISLVNKDGSVEAFNCLAPAAGGQGVSDTELHALES